MPKLARVLDPEESSREEGCWGRLRVDVPEAWFAASDAIEVVVPPRVTCARCAGGGCDACGRSGALRLASGELARTLRLALPPDGAGKTLRLVRPLDGDEVEQLWVELRAAEEPSAFCRRVAPDRSDGPRGRAELGRGPFLAVALVVLAVAAAVWAGIGR